MAGLCTRPLRSSVVTYSGLRSSGRRLESGDVDDLAVDVVAAPGGVISPAGSGGGAAAATIGIRRAASAVTSGRAAARVGGSSNSAPTHRAGQAGDDDEHGTQRDQHAVGRRPLHRGCVRPDCSRRMWRLTCDPASASPTTNVPSSSKDGPAEADGRRQRDDDRQLDDRVEDKQPHRHIDGTSPGPPWFRRLSGVTTIKIDTPDGPIDALMSVPDGQGPWPGVVVVHDAIGYGPDNESTSARIAAAGFVAITPNLFSRGGRARCITRVMRELLTQRGRALDDILAARDHVQSMPECTGTVGVVGFCMGGQFALVMAPKGFGASAPFYGTPLPRHLSETLDGACPIVASFGRRDPMGIGAPARLRKVVADKGIAADIKVYPDAGHSFANKLPGQPLLRITGFGYNDAATEDAYSRVFAFFNEHLASPRA